MRPFRAFTAILMVLLLASASVLYVERTKEKTINNQHVVDIYERLARNTGQQDVPPLVILVSPIMNAWTDGETVVITTAMLGIMENDDQLALVLGHEIAHAINNDMLHEDQEQSIVEAHADKLGAFIMMRAGFDICRGKDLWLHMKELFGDTAANQDHPNFAFRYDQLNLPQCSVFN